ncbi:MAG: hypothetical protein ACI4V7_08955, partial [Succinivibrionaceae bacterium]
MNLNRNALSVAMFLAISSLATACGGGGGGSSSNNEQTSVNKSTEVQVRVIDGYLEGVSGCIDLDFSKTCDENDILSTGKSDNKGILKFKISDAKYDKFKENKKSKVLINVDETAKNYLYDKDPTNFAKKITLTRTIFTDDILDNQGENKILNVTPFTTIADQITKEVKTKEEYNKGLEDVATKFNTTKDAIEEDYNDKSSINVDKAVALQASTKLAEGYVTEEVTEDLEINTLDVNEIDKNSKEFRDTIESFKNEELTPEELSEKIQKEIENNLNPDNPPKDPSEGGEITP